ncbi:MAG: M48 family metallopeptidase, partial [Bacteroidia bacterium]
MGNRILDHLLKDDLTLRRKLEVCVLNDASSNAYTLENGMIMLTLGLISKLQTEAQLAFVLAHEVIHFKNEHGLNLYKNSTLLLQRAANGTDYFEKVSAFSREQEMEADREGFDLYCKSGYAIGAAFSVLAITETGDLPFAQTLFRPSFFDYDDYKFPQGYELINIDTTSQKEETESYASHPTTMQRLDSLRAYAARKGVEGGVDFLISEPWFKINQEDSRAIICTILLEQRRYAEAIYMGFLLCKIDSNDLFAKRVIGKALYQLSRYSIATKVELEPKLYVNKVRPQEYYLGETDEESDEGEYPSSTLQQRQGGVMSVYNLFETISKVELTTLALNWNWRVYMQA